MKTVFTQIWLPLLGSIALDQISKKVVLDSHVYAFILNRGLIGGVFSDASPWIKIMALFAMFFIATTVFILLQFLFFKTEKFLSVLMSILLGAFCSNLIDKFRFGGAVDFIPVRVTQNTDFVLNVADFIQQITCLLLIVYFLKNHEKLWPELNIRKKWIINRSFQITSALFTAIFSTLAGAGIAVFSYLFFAPLPLGVTPMIYFVSVTLFLTVFFIIVFTASIVFFSRAAGPVFAAIRFIELLDSGEYTEFKLRKTDYFKDLEQSLTQLATRVKSKEPK